MIRTPKVNYYEIKFIYRLSVNLAINAGAKWNFPSIFATSHPPHPTPPTRQSPSLLLWYSYQQVSYQMSHSNLRSDSLAMPHQIPTSCVHGQELNFTIIKVVMGDLKSWWLKFLKVLKSTKPWWLGSQYL